MPTLALTSFILIPSNWFVKSVISVTVSFRGDTACCSILSYYLVSQHL
jgi:ERCC4-related helicase